MKLCAIKHLNATYAECLRDIGLEDEARKLAYPIAEYSTYHRICQTMAGEEISRAYAFGNDPKRHVSELITISFGRSLIISGQGDYAEASPCSIASLPQSQLEPLLVRYATCKGFQSRFDTKFWSFKQDQQTGQVESIIEDLITSQKSIVRSKYLCGADGAGSTIVRDLELPLHDMSPGGLSINLLVEADMVGY